MSKKLVIDDVVKTYGSLNAVDHISLTIQSGEFFTLLGPSGCGKTTLLRMIAGFNTIDQGNIYFDEQRINDIDPHKRNTGMVFQNYAIFPHMSVYDNVAYGLKARKIKGAELDTQVKNALQMMRIEEYASRSPDQLSGGQQQRVALARSIAIKPDILLMDEPLSNLDAKLRVEMRSSIKQLQRQLKITTVYVTHDQEEALAISDRIAVMNKGKVMQLDAPETIYRRPSNTFVANFIGTSSFLPCQIKDGRVLLEGKDIGLDKENLPAGDAILSVRPEEYLICENGQGILNNCEILLETFLGDFISYDIKLPNNSVIQVNEYTKDTTAILQAGTKIGLNLSINRINLFDALGKVALL